MTTYRPFLKAKLGELEAVRSSPHIGTSIEPVWELVPSEKGDAVNLLVGSLAASPHRVPWRIDTGHLATGRISNISLVDQSCRTAGIAFVPVLRPDAPEGDLVAAAAAAQHHGRGVLVRLMAADGVLGTADLVQAKATVTALGLSLRQADVVLDCWRVPDDRSASLLAGALMVPLAAAVRQGWRSVTVLAGAFPRTWTNVPLGGPTLLPRHDAELFLQLAVAVDFGDFGVSHPAPPSTNARGSAPNLRWNVGDNWAIYKERDSSVGAAFSPFLTVCANVHSNGHLRGVRSPGAAEISARATGHVVTTGNAMKWPEWGTSHHLAMVRHRLASGTA